MLSRMEVGRDVYKRQEWDTYRRRMKEQREEESRRATEKLVEDIIPVLDDFERSIDYANENGEEGPVSYTHLDVYKRQTMA